MTGANRFGATGLSGLGAFRGCPVVVSSGCSEADLCLLFRTFRVHPPLPLGSADLFKELSERHLSRRDVRRRALLGRGFTGPARSAPQAAALSFSNAELFRRLRSRSPDAACCKICSATSSVVTDLQTATINIADYLQQGGQNCWAPRTVAVAENPLQRDQ